MVRWFLEAGANPNISICQYGNINIPNFLDAGSHLNKKQLFKRFGSPYYPNLDSTSHVPPLPLSYLCSRVIRFHDIPIENQLPPRLQFFVRHSSTFLGLIR
uniref:Uncharacterized protein n=1 Tax=Daphnia galeata TaxID=27404 RepID=A0A8J2WFV2_9CRUS|nr:unnamed protein product [Daphnia galeata]